ncbi:hypothetical protein SCHPADRAFT_904881 [Schizopora paradoxa]|uniref:F-box domain-containing protein n=1 Tax=Schizopora paradoxa TaxID=27342 RepID=A0A0H2RTG2_9AGAM|nr:hypothetical protein SCHPADRAFT_904881 [Schizopora paradoxa]
MSTDPPTQSALHLLPVELWKVILRLATLPSAQFEESKKAAFGWQFSSKPDPAALSTKLAIALTCRYLWVTGSEYLYETVVLSSASDAQGLLDRMAEDTRLQIGLDIGSKVHVLILTPASHVDENLYGKACGRFVSLCGNISSMRFCPAIQFRPWMQHRTPILHAPASAMHTLASSIMTILSKYSNEHAGRLKELDIHLDFRLTASGGITYTDIVKRYAPSLERLRLVGPMARTTEGSILSFPNLTHLAIMRLPDTRNNVSRIFHGWTVDSLTHFYVDSYMNDESLQTFWATPRPNIVFLHLGRSLNVARTITKGTPNLEVLEYVSTVIWGEVWTSGFDSYELPKKLKHVVVQTYSSIEPDESSSLFTGPPDVVGARLDDLACQIMPFLNPRLPSLETFTVRVPFTHVRELGRSIDSLGSILGPGVIVLDTDGEA